jgi:LmbE family N-acetylglucosaminyl deacetylase
MPFDEGWLEKKKILVILAHPDDPDFFCGAMIARWCENGHEVSYLLLTKGQRGSQDSRNDPNKLGIIRQQEQTNAAKILGVSSIHFLDHMDGELVPDLELRTEIITEIRKLKPHIVVSCDPTNLFPAENRINHPDHRAAGQAVLDAVFPASGNPAYQLMTEDGILEAHAVEEVWLSLTQQPNTKVDLSNFLEQKISAILAHSSQTNMTREGLREKYRDGFEVNPKTNFPVYIEKFLRIRLNPK